MMFVPQVLQALGYSVGLIRQYKLSVHSANGHNITTKGTETMIINILLSALFTVVLQATGYDLCMVDVTAQASIQMAEMQRNGQQGVFMVENARAYCASTNQPNQGSYLQNGQNYNQAADQFNREVEQFHRDYPQAPRYQTPDYDSRGRHRGSFNPPCAPGPDCHW